MTGRANQRFQEALAFAVQAHGAVRHERKGTTFPYVVHPIRVAEILGSFECDEDVVVAGFLHDTIEDADVTADEISAAFGTRVAALVSAASEPDKSLPHRERKEHTIAYLKQERDKDVLSLVAADKLDNVRAIVDTLRQVGDERTWARFNAGKPEQHWYYRAIAASLLEAEPANRLFRTLDFETQNLFPDKRQTTNFLAGKPLGNPHDARAYLGDPIKHWRPNCSAYELANSWIGSAGIPPRVREVLDTCDVYAGCALVEGLVEREVELGTPGWPSQTDLLALVKLADGACAVIAVEGKTREPFGPLVSAWNDTTGKQARLEDLCRQLGLDPSGAGGLRYQLLHRTVSALLEAKRYCAREALMLVHSFDPADSSLDDYQVFAAALGVTNAFANQVTSATPCADITLRLAWAKQK